MNVCTLVWEGDCGNAALYNSEGKRVHEFDNGEDISVSDFTSNECGAVRLRLAETAGDTCRIYTNFRTIHHPLDPEEWDFDLAWPDEIGDGQWLIPEDEEPGR